MGFSSVADPAQTFAALMLLVLLALTTLWHIPMMLWDQMDMVPLYDAWQRQALTPADLFQPRAGHLHGVAYLVLLVAAKLTHGDPWLECTLSWLLLATFVGIVLRVANKTLPQDKPRRVAWTLLVIFFAVSPGHLANLQWGWQIAVFMNLVATAVVVETLAMGSLSSVDITKSLVAGIIAYLSFATAIALLPMALILLALRHDLSLRRRAVCAGLWLLAGVIGCTTTVLFDGPDIPASPPDTATLLHYVLNFLGAATSRFAPYLAPILAFVAIAASAMAYVRSTNRQAALPWLGFASYGLCAALVIAAARTGTYGADHAFATRYVSFSSLFWMGSLGLLILAPLPKSSFARKANTGALLLLTLLAVVNAGQMIRKAARIGGDTAAIAEDIRERYPNVPTTILKEIYFDAPVEAQQHLTRMHALGLAPFDREVDAAQPH